MAPERLAEVAALGGRAVPAAKRAFSNKRLAKSAGKTGGRNVPAEKRSFAANPELAREAGRKGGMANRKRLKEARK